MIEGLFMLGEKPMPDKKEKIKIIEKNSPFKIQCNACPKHRKKLFHIIIGDTVLIKMCTSCMGRFQNALRKKHI